MSYYTIPLADKGFVLDLCLTTLHCPWTPIGTWGSETQWLSGLAKALEEGRSTSSITLRAVERARMRIDEAITDEDC